MKGINFLFILLFSTVWLFAQNEVKEQKLKALKLYSNFSLSSYYLEYGKDTTNGTSQMEYAKTFNGFNFSPAFVFYLKNGNSSEIEISRLNFSNNYNKEYTVVDSTGTVSNVISGNNQKHFDFYFRYEYKLMLLKNKEQKKFSPVIGFSATPFFIWEKTYPLLSTDFPKTRTRAGLYLSVIPRIKYNINEKWFFDLNTPVAFSTYQYTYIKNENPVLNIADRKTTVFDFYNTPLSIAVRFGIGFKIS